MTNDHTFPTGESEAYTPDDRTEMVNPIAAALTRIIDRKAARPQDVYRLAILVEGILESLDDPAALATVRGELRVLINDLSHSMPDR